MGKVLGGEACARVYMANGLREEPECWDFSGVEPQGSMAARELAHAWVSLPGCLEDEPVCSPVRPLQASLLPGEGAGVWEMLVELGSQIGPVKEIWGPIMSHFGRRKYSMIWGPSATVPNCPLLTCPALKSMDGIFQHLP